MRSQSVSGQVARVVGASLVCALACSCYYVGLALAIALTSENPGPATIGIDVSYCLGVVACPGLLGIYLARFRHWRWTAAVTAAAMSVLAIHALLLPVAIAAFAM